MAFHSQYIGRFAPSPSGPLHMGSLLAALASFLDARANHGKWLLRIEDLDFPRSVKGADIQILDSLRAHGLYWDDDVVYQSQRLNTYHSAIAELTEKSGVYYCQCTRKLIQAAGGVYQGTCRDLSLPAEGNALRYKLSQVQPDFYDAVQGHVTIEDKYCFQDPVILRRDGIIAYNLGVVVDDIAQGVTHIVRGHDLLSTTPVHLHLYNSFGHKAPNYAHVPVLCASPGHKLSKQNHAKAIANNTAGSNVYFALSLLGLEPPKSLVTDNPEGLIHWAIAQWHIDKIPKAAEIVVATGDSSYYSDPQ